MGTNREQKILVPTRGLNNRDNITAMEPGYATLLDNIIPKSRECVSRGGTKIYADTKSGKPIETLMMYSGKTQNFFASSGGSIFELVDNELYDPNNPSTGLEKKSIVSIGGRKSTRDDFVMFSNVADNFLYVVNGYDHPIYFNGKDWIQPNFKIPAKPPEVEGGETTPEVDQNEFSKTLFSATVHASRLFFLERNSLSFWYLATNAIAGELIEFELGAIFSKGGNVVCAGSWSRDGGAGANDLFCIFTDKGQVAIYRGTNPSSIDNWSKEGVFNIGTIAGFPQDGENIDNGVNATRSIKKLGADLYVITSDGLISMGSIQPSLSIPEPAVSDAVVESFHENFVSYNNKFGWDIEEYARGSFVIINVPIDNRIEPSTKYIQYVQNQINKSWCRFTEINSNCWGLYKQELFYGSSGGSIFKYDVGGNDNGKPINCRMVTYYSDSDSAKKKIYKTLIPTVRTSGDVEFSFAIDVDYRFDYKKYRDAFMNNSTSLWGEATWNTSLWNVNKEILHKNIRLTAMGRAGSVHCFFQTTESPVSLLSFYIDFAEGGFI